MIVSAVGALALAGHYMSAGQSASGGESAPSGLPGAGQHDTGRRSQHAPQGGYLRLQPEAIVDASGFQAPMVAATLLKPHGWIAEGGVRWSSDYLCTNGLGFDWLARSPGGESLVAVLPQRAWEFNNYGSGPTRPGCQIAQVTSARQYLESSAASLEPSARIVGYRSRPDLVARAGIQTGGIGPGLEVNAEGGEVAFETTTRDGRRMRGMLLGVIQFTSMVNANQMGSFRSVFAMAHPQFMVIAPADQYDAALFEAVSISIAATPQWSAAVSGHNANIARDGREIQARERDFAANARAYTDRLLRDTWGQQAASAERQLREFGELMRGVRTFDDADAPGGTREFNATYDYAYRLTDGSYILTTDPNFEPWQDLNLEARRLSPTR